MDTRDLLTPVWILVATCVAIATVNAQNYDVQVVIYQMSLGTWDSSGVTHFKSAVSETANSYCAETGNPCQMADNWESLGLFGSSQVEITDGYPTYTSPYLTTKFVLEYPTVDSASNASSSQDFVSRSAVQTISQMSADRFRNYSGNHIVEVDSVELALPPDSTLNIAISIVGIIILLIILAVCLIMNWKCGTPPEAVSKEDLSDPKKDPAALEMTSVETVKASRPADSANGAKAEAVTVEA